MERTCFTITASLLASIGCLSPALAYAYPYTIQFEDFEAYYQPLHDASYEDQSLETPHSIRPILQGIVSHIMQVVHIENLSSLRITWQQQVDPLLRKTIETAHELVATVDWNAILEELEETDAYFEDLDVYGSNEEQLAAEEDQPSYTHRDEYGYKEYASDEYDWDTDWDTDIEAEDAKEELDEQLSNSVEQAVFRGDRKLLLGLAQTLESVGTTLHELSQRITRFAEEEEAETALQSSDVELTR